MVTAVPMLQSPDRIVNQIQSNLINAINDLRMNVLVGGNLLKDISLIVGGNVIPHGLARPLTGWSIGRMKSVFSQLYDTQDTGADPSTYLYLNSSAAVVVNIYVY